MPLYVLDSDSCIYALKGTHPLLVQRLMDSEPGELGTTAITVAELRYGMLNSTRAETNLARLGAFLSQLVVINFDETSASHYAEIRLGLSRRGQLIGSLDMLIAAATRAAAPHSSRTTNANSPASRDSTGKTGPYWTIRSLSAQRAGLRSG